ncbi:hypothetical protein CLOP_g8646 [Closterium sp. NIES-67]|nr:hypothetical protein CLOP_g8646 [Closterium sp. NIES-67]
MASGSGIRRIGQSLLAASPSSFVRSFYHDLPRDPGLVIASIRAHYVQQHTSSCSRGFPTSPLPHKTQSQQQPAQQPFLSQSLPYPHFSSRFISVSRTRHNHSHLQSRRRSEISRSHPKLAHATIHGLDLSSSSPAVVPSRSLNIFTVFRKESREKEIERLKDELNRGYFDDFKELKETAGKVGPSPTSSPLPAAGAAEFPRITGTTSSNTLVELPLELQGDTCRVVLVCVAFRANAQGMVESWLKPFLQHTSPSSPSVHPASTSPTSTLPSTSKVPSTSTVPSTTSSSSPASDRPHSFLRPLCVLCQISWVESWLLSVRPVRSWLLSSLRGAEAKQQARLTDAAGDSEGVDGVLTDGVRVW